MRKIADYDVSGKKVLVRVDFNCPVENGMISGDTRIRAHAKTIKELSDRGAKVIVLSHQGRVGRDDFLNLEQHAKALHRVLGKDVLFVDDIVGNNAQHAISKLKNGEILVLDNVRLLKCEIEHPDGDGEIVYHLSKITDYFVLDALSVAHRNHSSVVGFCRKMPCFVGDIMAAEIDAVDKVRHGTDVTFILGGSKVDDSFKIMSTWLSNGKAKEVLVGGALAVLLLRANGYNVGESENYLKNSNLSDKIPKAKELLDKFDGKIVLPIDVGLSIRTENPTDGSSIITREDVLISNINKGQIWDVGDATIKKCHDIINNSHYIVMNGPLGVYEIDDFARGTKKILESIANCDAFSLIGGGHTITAIDKFGINSNHFSYVSLSGKALIKYICGEELCGITALEENEKKFPIYKSNK
ncbi:phosphoglycerate kinase [Candidatus Micrarchaeota archaeon]|nr:phosphoglycerate kinase [Candidatus Micrarchaeota archaeon]MBU1165899.1 phosphoglycerate kinase [Candidatus Micrarchaeota archaeon]MBU1887106.1 phosphoglycerate kinase [Candidatus Micrarchaeota archaeon]